MKSFELDKEFLKLLLEGDDLLDCRLEYEPPVIGICIEIAVRCLYHFGFS